MIDPEAPSAPAAPSPLQPARWITLGYLVLCLGVWGYWLSHERDYFSGDQPHYLIIASAIVDHGRFEVSEAYRSEIEANRFRIGALIEAEGGDDGDVSDDDIAYYFRAHAVKGAHGLYNVHNIGLPLLLSPALAISEWGQGILLAFDLKADWVSSLPRLGCMAFMLLLSGALPLLVWSSSGLFFDAPGERVWVSVALACSAPFTYAAQQVYPDIPAGLISAAGLLYCFARCGPRKTTGEEEKERRIHWAARPGLALGIALLPWLQIRFFAPALLLAVACTLVDRRSSAGRRDRSVWAIPLSFGVSTLVLVLYNEYAFGQMTGPYREGSLSLAPEAWMVLLGLHVDQLHGIFLVQPLMLAAVLGLAALCVVDWRLAALTGALHASLVVPTALHPNWYGGFSLAGRFGWAGSIILLLPALYGLALSWKRFPRATRALVVASIGLQLFFVLRFTVGTQYLYNQHPDTWLSSYSSLYAPLQSLLPALYDIRWAGAHPPNYAWALLLVGLALWGASLAATGPGRAWWRRALPIACLALALAGALAGWGWSPPGQHATRHWYARAASPPGDSAEASPFLPAKPFPNKHTSPFISLRAGRYVAHVRYRADVSHTEPVGYFVVRPVYEAEAIFSKPLWGTNYQNATTRVEFEVDASHSRDTFIITASTESHAYVGIEEISLEPAEAVTR